MPSWQGLKGHRTAKPSAPLDDEHADQRVESDHAKASDSRRGSFAPASETSATHAAVVGRLRVQVLGASGLVSKDRNGKSDPFITINLPGAPPLSSGGDLTAPSTQRKKDKDFYRRTTPVQPKTLEPTWKESEATFEWDVTPQWYGMTASQEGQKALAGPSESMPVSESELEPASADSDEEDEDNLDGQTEAKERHQAAMLQVEEVKSSSQATAPHILVRPSESEEKQGEDLHDLAKDDDPQKASSSASGDHLVVAGDRIHPQRPSNVRKISGAAGRILAAPVRMTYKGTVATTKVVRKRGRPRPMRLRKGPNQSPQNRIPTGSALLNSHGHLHSCVGSIEFVVWDKDKWSGNDYMGECSLEISQWFHRSKSAAWSASEPLELPLVSTRRNSKVTGQIRVRIGFVDTDEPSTETWPSADELYSRFLASTRRVEGADIRSIPANQSVGTTGLAEAYVDDGLSSGSEDEAREELLTDEDEDEDDDDDRDEDDDGASTASFGDGMMTTDPEEYSDYGAGARDELRTSASPSPEPKSDSQGIAGSLQAPKESTPSGSSVTSSRRGVLPRRLRKERRGGGGDISGSASDLGDVEQQKQRRSKKKGSEQRQRRRLPTKKASRRGTETLTAEEEAADRQRRKRAKGQQRRRRQNQDFAFKSEMGMDIIGIVQMEVKSAQDLPRWKNSLGTSFDMDPFVIVSFGQKIFRTRVVRHTLNPSWDEKLLFHVRRHEENFVTKLAVYDWDKLSSNDFVGATSVSIESLIKAAPTSDPETGLYAANDDGMHDMISYSLPLGRDENSEDGKTLGKHSPVLSVEAKFTPYDSLRQRFWRQLLTQYDTNDSGTLSSLELATMLDSLGSTLSAQTLGSWFAQFNKKPDEQELTIDECIRSLELEIKKPWSEKRYVAEAPLDLPQTPAGSGTQTPATSDLAASAIEMDYSGPAAPSAGNEEDLAGKKVPVPQTVIEDLSTGPRAATSTEASVKPLTASTVSSKAHPGVIERDMSTLSLGTTSSTSSSASQSGPPRGNSDHRARSQSAISDAASASSTSDRQVERVIVLKSCPLCHMPRLSKKAEVDIVTHLAVCASQDWRRVDSMVVGNFVTASQAHRKWYTKVFTKISQGQYQLGANSANIIVQDRMSGELLEEKMQVYVRLGIRLLYKGASSRMEGARIRRMLKNMSVKQGQKYDSPLSAREIPHFIAFHKLNVDEIRDPLDSFKTFNQFFYRKLKEGARPIADPNDPTTLVSSADCRLMAFASTDEATKIWIKGREFTVERLLGEKFKDRVSQLHGGGLVIFRLAPQDYHRFHVPADATVGDITFIEGQYYTVNPMAIRSTIDVYGENVRCVVPFHSETFGTFYNVCIGAMMVGSINLTIKPGDKVKRGDDFGYYAFGGSTNVCVFEKGAVQFDEDLLANSRAATETLVRVGMRIGKRAKRE